ncbi:dihydroxyacetone kinase [Lipomyces starkeyi]
MDTKYNLSMEFLDSASTVFLRGKPCSIYLHGLIRSNPTLNLIESDRIVYRDVEKDGNVVVISGGGSGHEPAHAGYEGRGMQDVAVAGNIFASPSTRQVVAGIKCRPSRAGTLIIVENYTGDVLHFGLAAERARADGIPVEVVIVGDDVAVGRTKGGSSLAEVSASAHAVADNLVTIGASLDHCAVPGSGSDEIISLAVDELEIGMGIHNETGVTKISPIPTANELVGTLLKYLLSGNDKERSYVSFEKSVLLINNLGGMSVLEITAISQIVEQQLRGKYGIFPCFSITLLNTTKAGGKRILELLDATTDAPGWNAYYKTSVWASKRKVFHLILTEGMHSVLRSEPLITRYDTVAGEGDCGETLACGANAILSALTSDSSIQMDLDDIIESSMDGASGGIYDRLEDIVELDVSMLGKGCELALATLYKYTNARIGDRTLIDVPLGKVTRKLEAKFG